MSDECDVERVLNHAGHAPSLILERAKTVLVEKGQINGSARAQAEEPALAFKLFDLNAKVEQQLGSVCVTCSTSSSRFCR